MNKKHVGYIILAVLVVSTINACTPTQTTEENLLLGSKWSLREFTKTSIVQGTEITLEFEEAKIRGSAGCNSYFGTYEIDDGSITFKDIGNTEMYCMDPEGVMDQEVLYLDLLSGIERFSLSGEQLQLFGSDLLQGLTLIKLIIP